jgi:hypothetical protein
LYLYTVMETRIKVLVPRRSKEEREKNYRIATLKKVQEYIKNGSQDNLDLKNTPITSLPDNLTKVEGSLYLENTPITSLPDNLTVGGYLDLENTPITSLPDNLTVEGSLYLGNTPISKQYTKEQIKQMAPGIKGNIYF